VPAAPSAELERPGGAWLERDNAGNRVLAETARKSHILVPAISPDE
jgi:hypothetical protein